MKDKRIKAEEQKRKQKEAEERKLLDEVRTISPINIMDSLMKLPKI